ncbi:MAG: hypothetical protein K1X94_35300 [Sandaracinaceae bacterium]|nr:hypothetical protein [Sandaracinaceae bacterium]
MATTSDVELTLDRALLGARSLSDDAHAVHAGERLAWAMSQELAPAVSLSRTPLAPMWMERWAACQALGASGPLRLVRTATIVRTATDLVCIDPCLPDAWARTPLGERMRSLHPRETSETFPMTLTEALGPPGHFTEVIFTSVGFQSLRELLGATHGDGLEHALAPYFQGARVIVGPSALSRARTELDRSTDVRDGFARLRVDHVTEITGPTLLPSGLVAVPTGGYVPEHLAVAFVQKIDRPRVAVVTSQVTSREQLSPYESSLPGLREHARLRDTELAPRGDAADRAAHVSALRFERALADRDPADPRFHLVYPSQAHV